jgi:hypothetical protein
VYKFLEIFDQCKVGNALIATTPEARLSIRLRIHELKAGKILDIYEILCLCESNYDFFDIYDESDFIFRPQLQLVYSSGEESELPQLSARMDAIQNILRICNGEETIDWLQERGVGEVTPNSFGFKEIRLYQKFDESEFRDFLCDQLFKLTGSNLDWVITLNEEQKKSLKKWLTDWNSKGDIPPLKMHFPGQLGNMMALAYRGLIGGRLIEHCLTKRYRVNYGLRESSRIAVPFRAANVPDEKTEFNHPDIALIFTHLSYYHTGLSHEDCVEMIRYIQNECRNPTEFYEKFVNDINPNLKSTEVCQIQNIYDLDVSNEEQILIFWRAFQYSLSAINFYLRYCALSNFTVYSGYSLATSWHLKTLKGTFNGLSGTSTRDVLLPSWIKAHDAPIPSVLAADSRIIDNFMKNILSIQCLSNSSGPISSCFLNYALEDDSVTAIIDSGGLLAGISNLEAAKYLMVSLERKKLQGIIFFHNDNWMVLDRTTNLMVAREYSNLDDSDAFVIYDDARTRGVDFKLRSNAVGLLSLGPEVGKDKLIQAAGRLRRLGNKQKLIVAASKNILEEIRGVENTILPVHIVTWSISNSCADLMRGANEWHKRKQEFEMQQFNRTENWDLAIIYGGHAKQKSRLEMHPLASNSNDGEQEFTFVKEVEFQEQGIEIQRKKLEPASDFLGPEKILRAKYVETLFQMGVKALRSCFPIPIPPKFAVRIKNVYCTHSFNNPIQNQEGNRVSLHRPIHGYVVYPNSQVLLLSDIESELVLEQYDPCSSTKFHDLSEDTPFSDIFVILNKAILYGDFEA